jgi:hypothetical protein
VRPSAAMATPPNARMIHPRPMKLSLSGNK